MWRVLPAAAAAFALVSAAPAAAAPPAGWRPDVEAARAYAESRAGTVAFAVRTERGGRGFRSAAAFPSASVVKAMLLVAYLRRPDVRGRALTPADRDLLTPMVRWSSNRDATAVFERLGPAALPALAHRAGMLRFTGGTYWSASQITAADQARFFLRIDRLLPDRHRAYAMGLLRRIVPAQRWGVANVTPRGWALYFKGGWTRTVEHQAALLTRGRERVAVAVLTRGSPDAAYARATQEGVFRRLLRGLEGEVRGRWTPVHAAAVAEWSVAAPAAAAAPRGWRSGVRAARAYAAQRGGVVAFAVRTDRGVVGRLRDRAFPAASVVKAMLLAAYLRQPAVRRRALTAAERARLDPMVRRSDDVAATRIRDALGSGALARFARRAGMTRFEEAPLWGASLTTARDQTRFMLKVDRLLPPRHRAYALSLLRRIVPSQRWGFARAVPRGWTLYFKGGWGSGTGLVDHQVALLTRGRERVSIAVFTLANPGGHAYGKRTLEGAFRRLTRGLRR